MGQNRLQMYEGENNQRAKITLYTVSVYLLRLHSVGKLLCGDILGSHSRLEWRNNWIQSDIALTTKREIKWCKHRIIMINYLQIIIKSSLTEEWFCVQCPFCGVHATQWPLIGCKVGSHNRSISILFHSFKNKNCIVKW